MIETTSFAYTPGEHEAEKASNSYLMSLVAVVAGLPLPIINLLATFFFFVANRKATSFVRWHCTQALVSQLSLLVVNSIAFWWTISVVFGSSQITNEYLAYFVSVLVVNLSEFVATVYTATQTRKGLHVKWWFYGPLTDLLITDTDRRDPWVDRPMF